MPFVLKLAIVPFLVVALSWIGRRFGPEWAGLLVGLPLATGPATLFLTLSHGPTFGLSVARGVLLGLAAAEAFVAAYAQGLRRGWDWLPSLGAALLAFLASAFLVAQVRLEGWLLPVSVLAPITLTYTWLSRSRAHVSSPIHRAAFALPVPVPPLRGELALRAILATAVVLLVTVLANVAGPTIGGIIAPIPVVTAIVAVFTHRSRGGEETYRLLRAMVQGTFSFWAFFAVLWGLLTRTGLPWAFALSCFAGVLVQAVFQGHAGRQRPTHSSVPAGDSCPRPDPGPPPTVP